jgi:S-adenosylmethionine:tRNA ribosyltransferase-isomerase
MNLKDFWYDLPERLIAQESIGRRDIHAFCVEQATGEIQHKHFYDILDYLQEGDCLVVNNTASFPRGSRPEEGYRRNIDFVL